MCSFSDAQTDMEADESAEKLSCVKNSLSSAPTCAPSTASLRHPAAFMESHCPLSLADQFNDIRRADSHHPSSTENQWSSSSICSTYYSNDFCWREAGKKGMVTNCCGFIRYMCVRLHMWCQTSLQPALIFCSNTMVSQLEGQFTPKSKDVRLLFSVMELDGTGYGVQNIEKNSTVSLSGNHNLVPRDNPQALNYFLSVSLHRRKRASTHQASCQAANPTVKVKWLLFDQCRAITFGKSGRS